MKNRRLSILVKAAGIIAATILLVVGCSPAATPTAAPNVAPQAAAPTQAQKTAAPAAKPADGAAKASTAPSAQAIVTPVVDARMIVRTAKMNLIVDDVSAKLEALASISTERGGYVSASSANDDGAVTRGQITMKLPPPQLDAAMADVRKLAKKVSAESSTSQDLTEEYYDVDAQLKALKAQEEQYLEFLKKAVNIDETLRVQSAISGVRVEINKLEGRSRYIERSAAMSTLSVDMQTAAPIVEEKRVNDKAAQEWPDALAAARESLLDMARFVAKLGVVALRLAIWLPVWGPVVAVCYLLWRRAHRASVKPVASGTLADAGRTPATAAAIAAAIAAATASAAVPAEAEVTTPGEVDRTE